MRISGLILVVIFLAGRDAGRAQPAPPTPAQPATPFNAQPVTAIFRQLLASGSEEEQKALLSSKTPQTQTILLEKLKEYRSLPSEVADRRLRLLDLRYYITHLRKLPPSERVIPLQTIPEKDRKLVKERLAIWDALPAREQEQVWLYNITQNYLISPRLPPSPPDLARVVPSSPQQPMEEIVNRWNDYPSEQRAQIIQHFKSIFEDDPQVVVEKLGKHAGSDQERQRIKITIQHLKSLQPDQREKALQGFASFVDLPLAGRQQFLNNATLWHRLDSEQRAALSNLTERLPPLPPGFYNPPPPPGMDPTQTKQ